MNEISNKWIGKNTVRPDGAEKVTGGFIGKKFA